MSAMRSTISRRIGTDFAGAIIAATRSTVRFSPAAVATTSWWPENASLHPATATITTPSAATTNDRRRIATPVSGRVCRGARQGAHESREQVDPAEPLESQRQGLRPANVGGKLDFIHRDRESREARSRAGPEHQAGIVAAGYNRFEAEALADHPELGERHKRIGLGRQAAKTVRHLLAQSGNL